MAGDSFNVNLFKPRTDHARYNMKIVFIMLTIWGVAVFGFQGLLIALQEPTPEPALSDFKAAWPRVESGEANPEERQQLMRSLLMVLGKNIVVKAPHKEALAEALNANLRALDASVPLDAERAAGLIGLKAEGFDLLMRDMLSTYVKNVDSPEISAEVKAQLPAIMDLYLIHNRSALTDARFIGFPFHYWYTAQFLLILFVLLCLAYAKLFDSANEKFGFHEEE